MHTLDSEHQSAQALDSVSRPAGEKLLADLARGMDAIFGAPTKVCRICGMTADPMKHWHDIDRPDSRAHDDLQRESAEYARQERRTVL